MITDEVALDLLEERHWERSYGCRNSTTMRDGGAFKSLREGTWGAAASERPVSCDPGSSSAADAQPQETTCLHKSTHHCAFTSHLLVYPLYLATEGTLGLAENKKKHRTVGDASANF